MTRFGQNNKKLPYDAKIQYLECDGKSYINLGFKQDFHYRLEAKLFIPFVKNTIYHIFGGIKSTADGGTWYVAVNAGTGPSVVVNTGQTETRIANNKLADGRILDIVSDSFSNVFRVCDISTVLKPVHATDRDFGLFANNGVGSAICTSGVRIYSFKYESDVTNVDLIPVRIEDTGYMYDRITGNLFKNRGTGKFVLGPDTGFNEYI